MKTTLFTILGVVLGVVAGAGGMHQWLMPQVVDLDFQLKDRDQKLAALETTDGSGARLARLEEERQTYEQKLNELRKQLEELQTASPAPSEAPALAEVADAATAEEAGAPEDAPPADGRRDRGGAPWDRDSTPEEREARRQEFVTQMQDNLTAFFTGELEKSSTPAMQERLVALESQVYDMMELRRQMRDAQDDTERDALREAFGETMAAAEATMKDQQRDMIDAIATQFNITDKGDKAAFQNAVRAAVKSPFFSDNPSSIFWSAGRPEGGYGGGRGGGPGRGGFGR